MSLIASKPNVFSIKGTNEKKDYPSLKGCKCKCGHVFFPRQKYGCEICGRYGDDIEHMELNGVGKLVSFVTVYHSNNEKYKAPYIVGTIILESNCSIQALIDVKDTPRLEVGQTLYSKLVTIGQDEEGNSIVDIRFTNI